MEDKIIRGETMYEEIIQEIYSIRKYHGIGLRTLAKASNTSPSYIKRLEDGVYKNPSYSKLAALACAIEELIKSKKMPWEETKYPNLNELLDWSEKHKFQEGKHYSIQLAGEDIPKNRIHYSDYMKKLEEYQKSITLLFDWLGQTDMTDMNVFWRLEVLDTMIRCFTDIMENRKESRSLFKLFSLFLASSQTQKELLVDLAELIVKRKELDLERNEILK